jgi:hypothetical protein
VRQTDTLDQQAPRAAHLKLDRLWLTREDSGQVAISFPVKDPDCPSSMYFISMTLSGVAE